MLAQRIEAARLREYAAKAAHGTLALNVADMPRLRALLASDSSFELELRVEFSLDHEKRPHLNMQISGAIVLVCQRCLEPLNWPVALSASLTVVDDEWVAAELAEPFDSVALVDGVLSLPTAIEDELLAAVPLAPMHDVADECHAPAAAKWVDESDGPPANRPFAALGSMLSAGQSGHDDQEN
ncbi:MAG: YceD family protein [Gammaproteobacteria bacterium]|nr:YceD family protein [Gammaproteobacteria bacterium]